MEKKPTKTVVITGISSGIGLELAIRLLEDNYHVVGTTRSGNLETLQHENLTIIPLELASEESWKEAAKLISNCTDDIGLLINNAGIAPDIANTEPDLQSFNHTLAINLTATVFFTEQVLKNMKDGAKIIFISSAMGLCSNAGVSGPAYRISKAALNMYAETLALRLEPKQITVAAMHPGWVRTKLGGPQAPFSSQQSAKAIYEQIGEISGRGRFYDAAANEILNY